MELVYLLIAFAIVAGVGLLVLGARRVVDPQANEDLGRPAPGPSTPER
jgi:hypothetical protein